MTDPYSGGPFSDPQSLRILREHEFRKASTGRSSHRPYYNTGEDTAVSTKELYSAKHASIEEANIARALINELVAKEYQFGNVQAISASSKHPVEPYIYDARYKIWKPLYTEKVKWEVILRAEVGMEGILYQRQFEALLTEAHCRCADGLRIDFDQPLGGVCFSGGIVYDLKSGSRPLSALDFRQFQGKTKYEPSPRHSENDHPELILELLGHMSGGSPEKQQLIEAACYLNITGIHTLPAFKSAFFIWACPNGYGGRSTLFNIINNTAGGDACVTLSHLSDLTDNNTLLRLRGRNYIYIDEAQDVSSARSRAIATLKSITGGSTRLEVWQKHKDKFEIQGHWIVNQCLNGTELLYAADKALIERSVPIVTETIPEEAQIRYRENPELQLRILSETECSKFLRYLNKKFGDPAEAAKVIDKVKKEFTKDLEDLVSQSDPLSEFLEQETKESPGKKIYVDALLSDYNEWLKRSYPSHRQMNLRNILSNLRRLGLSTDRQYDVAGRRVQVLLDRESSPSMSHVRIEAQTAKTSEELKKLRWRYPGKY
jgi:hypothetical protein